MKHFTKDEMRVQRSIERLARKCEKLMFSNLSRSRETTRIKELSSMYNLIEFVI